jgi:mercuric reductase
MDQDLRRRHARCKPSIKLDAFALVRPIMPQTFDLILGSGSTAFAAALRAAELGRTAAMAEERTLGGTCVNRGCLPSKNLIEAAHIYWESAHPRYPGLGRKRLDLDFGALVAGKDEVIARYRDRKYRSIIDDSDRIVILNGHAEIIDPHTARLDGRELRGDQVLIATGSRPAIPPIPALDEVPYLTSDLLTSGESLELTTLPHSLVIVGAGYIALELGQLFARLGTTVAILQRSDRILPDYEPEVTIAIHESAIRTCSARLYVLARRG